MKTFFFLNRQVKFRANFSIRERKIVVLTRGKSEMVIFFFFFSTKSYIIFYNCTVLIVGETSESA